MFINELLETIIDFVTRKKVYGPIITIFIAIIIYKIFLGIIHRIVLEGKSELDKKRKKTILNLFENIGKYIIVIIALLIILEIYGINTASLVTGLGVMGLVVGLALQDTLKDFIGGMSVIMDNYFVVGDVVEYNGFKGEVIAFGLRSTKVKKASGEVLTFANRNIMQIINYSQKNAEIILNISISNEESATKVEKALQSLIPEINKVKNVLDKGVNYLGLTDVFPTTTTYSFAIKCNRLTQNTVKRETLKIIQSTLADSKIKLLGVTLGG